MRNAMIIAVLAVLFPASVVGDTLDFVPGQVIVQFRDNSGGLLALSETGVQSVYPSLQEYLEEQGASMIDTILYGSEVVGGLYLIQFDDTADVLSICTELEEFEEVESASPNYLVHYLSTPNDWYYNNDWYPAGNPDPTKDQWHLPFIQADKAWDITRGDSTVTIAILDTGVDYFHPAFTGNIWVNPGEDIDQDGVVWDTADTNGVDNDGNGKIDDLIGWDFWDNYPQLDDNDPLPLLDSLPNTTAPHGTIMASIGATTNDDVSASDTSIAGMTWHCKIVPLRVNGFWGTIRALYYAAQMHFDVANMSTVVTSAYSTPLHNAIRAAYNAGVVLVGGANKYEHDIPTWPGSFAEVIQASTVDETGALLYPSEEAYSDSVDVCGIGGSSNAKSMAITGYGYLYPQHFPGSQLPHVYWYHQGSSSYSAAQVSALVGLLRSTYPDSSPTFIRHEILRGAIPVDMAPGNQGRDWQYKLGAGRINPYRSLTQWGPITSNKTWANVVYVSADIQVDTGATLTIEPGTTIYFAADDNGDLGVDPARVVFEVRGTLVADGTAQSPIVFKSLSQDPQPEDWYGIWFKQGASGSLSHCRIENAKYGLKHDSTIEIEDCEVVWNQWAHLWRDITIDEGLTLVVNPGTTVYAAPADTEATEPDTLRVTLDIRGALDANGTSADPITFKSSSDEPMAGDWHGLVFADEKSSGSLSHCTIQDARYGVMSSVTLEIEDCHITNCMTAGIYMYDSLSASDSLNNSSTIRRCDIEYAYDGAGMRIWNCPDTILVDSCTTTNNGVGIWVSNACPKITNSTASNNIYQGIWVTSYQYPAPYPRPVIRWCRMQGNDQEGIKCENNGAHVSYSKIWENGVYGVLAHGEYADPSIDHSKIIENPSAGVRAESDANPLLGAAGTPICQNSLYGQNQQKNVYNATSQYIYAQNCWWGSNPPNTSKFYGKLYYQPYLTSDPVYYLAPMKPKMPTALALDQNFPNPFNGTTGTTMIKYAIPNERERVVLRIYDVAGRRVRTLVDKPHQPGYYFAKWDGRNDRGARVAPGVYFCEMNVGKQSFTKKMVLFR